MNYKEVEQQIIPNISEIYHLSLYDSKSLEAMGLKLGEEFGELCEQINVINGNLPKKVLKEEIAGEIADMFNCLMCILFKAHPDLNYYECLALFNKTLELKNDKWRKVIS